MIRPLDAKHILNSFNIVGCNTDLLTGVIKGVNVKCTPLKLG